MLKHSFHDASSSLEDPLGSDLCGHARWHSVDLYLTAIHGRERGRHTAYMKDVHVALPELTPEAITVILHLLERLGVGDTRVTLSVARIVALAL